MNVGGGEAADQLVRMMLSSGEVAVRLSGSALKNMLALTLALAKDHKRISGKVNLGKMLRETRDLRQFPMTPEQYRQFQKLAKKQKLLYSAIHDRDDHGRLIDVIMPVTELDRANQIFERILYQEPDRRSERQTQEQPEKAVSEQQKGRQERQKPNREQSRQEAVRGRQDGPVAQRRTDTPKKGSRSGRDSQGIKTSSSTPRGSGAMRTTHDRPSVEGRLKLYRVQLEKKSAPAKQKTPVKARPKTR